MAKKKDNGLFGDGDSKALAAAVAKHNETEYAKAKRVTTATTRRGLSGDFSGNKTKSQRTAYSQRRSNIDVPELSTPKSSVKAIVNVLPGRQYACGDVFSAGPVA